MRTWGGPKSDRASGVAFDSSGNVLVTGMTASFGSGAFILKYNQLGNLIWQKVWTGNTSTVGRTVAADLEGNVYVVGGMVGAGRGLVSKLNSSGSVLWQKSWASSTGHGALDPINDVYVTGGYAGALLLLKFSSTGDPIWQRKANVTQSGVGLAVDASGDIYVLGSDPIPALLKFNSTGVLQWQRTWRLVQDWGVIASAVAVGPLGDIYVTGQVGLGDFGNVFVTRFAPNGTLVWEKMWPTQTGFNKFSSGFGIATDGSGSVYVTGDGDTNENVFLLKIDSAGDLLSAAEWGGGAYGTAIAVDSSQNPAIAGVVEGPISLKGMQAADQNLTNLNLLVSTAAGTVQNATDTSSSIAIPLADVNGSTTTVDGGIDVLLSYGASFPVPILTPLQVLLLSGLLVVVVKRVHSKGWECTYLAG